MGSLELLSHFWSLNTILVVQLENFDFGGLSHPPTKGLKFNVVNTEIPEALQAWFKADGKVKEEEEAVKVRELLEKKGVVMRMSTAHETETDLGETDQMWNARNKNLREYIHHHSMVLC